MTAWPAFQTVIDDGWVQRFAGGYTGRANSVYPLYPGVDALDAKIERAESRYRSQGLKPSFKLTAAACPANLDARLEARGYQHTKPTSVQVAALTISTQPPAPHSETQLLVENRLTGDWLTVAGLLRDMSDHDLELMAHILRLLVVPAAYVRLLADDEPIAVGLGVLDDGWVGLFDIATAEAWRGRGHGRFICQQILNWGQSQGAHHAYLQVMLQNTPALRLYESLGFTEAYQYWYWEQPQL